MTERNNPSVSSVAKQARCHGMFRRCPDARDLGVALPGVVDEDPLGDSSTAGSGPWLLHWVGAGRNES